MTTSPPSSGPHDDTELHLAIGDLVQAFSQLDLTTCPHLKEGAADTLLCLWLARGRNVRELPDQLKQAPVPPERQSAWAREIDNLLADHTRRPLELDRLRHEVGELVRQLNRQANDQGIYQKLVALGYECRNDLKKFQGCLRQAKLDKTRISEITRIIQSGETARQFIAGNLSVRRALLLARTTPDHNNDTSGPVDPKIAEARWSKRFTTTLLALLTLVGKIPGQSPQNWQIQVGMYQLSFQPIAPKPQPTKITVS